MSKIKIVTIDGDGIGPSIMDSTKKVLKTLNPNFEFINALAGLQAQEKTGTLLPQETIDLIKAHKTALKSPLQTPIGHGFKSINVQLRKELDLFANVRPIKTFQESLDLTIIRENTEGLYAGEQETTPTAGIATSIMTHEGCKRIIQYAIDYAKKNNRKKITLVHKANILKTTSGLMLKTFKDMTSSNQDFEFNDLIVDNACMQLVMHPERFDVIVTSNLFGDILSDLCAGLIGGLGLAPGSNIGHDSSIFEAVHGTAPDIVGKNLANPTALILSANLMLKQLNLMEESTLLEKTLKNVYLHDKKHLTGDMGGNLGTIEFTEYLCKKLHENK